MVEVSWPDQYIDLDYDYGEKPISYRVQLDSVPKHFGGREWYFLCPATGKRCRILYGIGAHFLSRNAYPSAMYSSQTQSKRWRDFARIMGSADRNDLFNRPYSRTHYNGKPTKRFRRWLAANGQREMAIDERGLIEKFLAI